MRLGWFGKTGAVAAGVAIIIQSGPAATETLAHRQKRPCTSSERFVKGYGCLSRKIIAQATKNCRLAGKNVPFEQCLCVDTNTVGACGD